MAYQPNFILGPCPSHNRMCLLLVCWLFSRDIAASSWTCVYFSFRLVFPGLFLALVCCKFFVMSSFPSSSVWEPIIIRKLVSPWIYIYFFVFFLCPEFPLILCLIQTNCFGCPTYVSFGVCVCVSFIGTFCCSMYTPFKQARTTHTVHTPTRTPTF